MAKIAKVETCGRCPYGIGALLGTVTCEKLQVRFPAGLAPPKECPLDNYPSAPEAPPAPQGSDESDSEARADYIDIVFDGPPSHESGRFVEVENAKRESIRVGEWLHDGDLWRLRIPMATIPSPPDPEAPPEPQGTEDPDAGLEWRVYAITCDEDGAIYAVEAMSMGEALSAWGDAMRVKYADDVASHGYEPIARQVTLVSEHPAVRQRDRRREEAESDG